MQYLLIRHEKLICSFAFEVSGLRPKAYLLAHKGIHITQHPSERNDIYWVHFARKTEGKLK